MTNIKKITAFYFLLIGISFAAKGDHFWGDAGKELKFKHLQVENGLSSNVTNCILQDSRGFLWFGTDAGLNRYDGFEIKTFKSGDPKQHSLSNSVITCLYEDHNGQIWIGTTRGLNLYDPKKDQFRYFLTQKGNAASLSNNTITCLTEDQHKNLWVGTFNGLNQLVGFNKEGEARFEHFSHNPTMPHSLSNNRISSLFSDKEGNLWVGTDGGGLNLWIQQDLKKQKPSFSSFLHSPSDPNSIGDNVIHTIGQLKDGHIYLGTEKGVTKIMAEGTKYRFLNYPSAQLNENLLPEYKIFAIIQAEKQGIWLGTFGKGLILFDPQEKNHSTFRHQPFNPQSLSRDFIYHAYKSKEGILWLATRETGIDRIDPLSRRFIHLKHLPNNPNSLSNSIIKGIIEGQDGRFWFGTCGGGLSVYDPKTKKFNSYQHSPTNKNSISSNVIQSLALDHQNRIWLGTSNGLNLFEPEKGKFTRFLNDPSNKNSLANNNLWHVLPAKDNSGIWIATYNGLDKYDWNKKRFYHFSNSPDDPKSLSFNFVRSLVEDDDNNLWIATWGGGLDKLNLKKHPDLEKVKMEHFRHHPEKDNTISSDLVNTLFIDSNGNLWVGTQGGLNLFEKGSRSFIRYTEKDGLADNVIKGILEDSEGNLWISTQKGMSKFNPVQKKFTNYYQKDGLQGDIFNLSSCLKNSRGEMMFGGTNGVSVFHPEKINERPHFPEAYISELKINDHLIVPGGKFNGRIPLQKALNRQKALNLSYNENSLIIKFSAIEYSAPEKIHFSYQLEGKDNSWHQTNFRNREVTYSDLKPGKYRFKLKTTNLNNQWSENETILTFNIAPPLWATFYAYLLYTVLITAIFYFLGRNIHHRILIKKELQREKEEHQRKIELNKFKLRFFTNISHEIRTPLTLISVPFQKLWQEDHSLTPERKQYYFKTIDSNIHLLQRLINQLLDFRKVEDNKMDLKVVKTDVPILLESYINSFSFLARQKEINLTSKIGLSQDQNQFYVDTEKLEKIIFNLLSNAVKFTPNGGKIEITLSPSGQTPLPSEAPANAKDSDFFSFTIKDTGVGIPPHKKEMIFERFTRLSNHTEPGTGIGLALTKKLVEVHKGFISVSSEVGQGSCFTIWLPSHSDAFSSQELAQPTTPSTGEAKQNTGSDAFNQHSLPESTGKKKEHTILIVEDQKDMRAILKDTLGEKYAILEAANGKEGLEKALAEGPDLVISDVMMPQMDGLEFCRRLKTNKNICHIPVILLTAKNAIEHQLEGLEHGADHYLAKPFNLQHLLLTIHNQLENRRKLQLKYAGALLPDSPKITIPSEEEKFLRNIQIHIEKSMEDPTFNVEALARQVGFSPVHLTRKLKAITGMTTNELIRSLRLKQAAHLLQQNKVRISDVAYAVGFNDPKYFRKCFKNEFGKSPSEYVKKWHSEETP